ncbi:hypothetical protein HY604_01505 [Candidatus Peregrinibacteria bacterium]|nr:hypothetical protein [Candidatus Peregrinibacteria bacterium]
MSAETTTDISVIDEADAARMNDVGGVRVVAREDIAALVPPHLEEGEYARSGLSTKVTDALCKALGIDAVQVGHGTYYTNATKI